MTAAIPPAPATDDGAGRKALLDLAPPGQEQGKRADAVRNREKVLCAAARLVDELGAAHTTMDAVAAAAGVGKGTLFRHFGDRTGLLLAVLDQAETMLQESFLSGPPPLGPGAPALDRLHAFGPAVLRHETSHAELYLASRPEPARRFVIPPYRVRLTHVAVLLRQVDPQLDVEVFAQTLLGYLDTASVQHLVRQRGMPVSRVEAGWHELVARVTGTAPRT